MRILHEKAPTTNWISLAKRDINRKIRGFGVWIFAISMLGIYYTYLDPGQASVSRLGSDAYILHLQPMLATVVPVAVLILSYRTIVAERETGRVKLTASMPHSRRDIVIGKFVAIGTVLSIVTVGVIGLVAAYTVARIGIPSPLLLVGFSAITVVFIFACVGIGVLLSVTFRRPLRATGATLATAFVLVQWQSLVTVVYDSFTDVDINAYELPPDGVLFFLRRLDPRSSFLVATNWLYETGNAAGSYWGSIVKLEADPDEYVRVAVFPAELTFDHDPPLYLSEYISVVLLLAWLIVPILIAVTMFNRGVLR